MPKKCSKANAFNRLIKKVLSNIRIMQKIKFKIISLKKIAPFEIL